MILSGVLWLRNRSALLLVRGLRNKITLKPEPTDPKRALKVAIVGCPNVGKSALTNELVRADICAVSKRMDTTRHNLAAAITEDSCQLLIVDSPGLVGIKHARDVVGSHSESPILTDPERAIKQADHLLVVHDATLPGKYLNHRILHILHRHSHLTASLVINKIDLVNRQSDLLELGATLTVGTVAGQSIQTQPVRMGKLGIVSSSNREMKLHSDLSEKDEKWKSLYQRLLQKPTHKCSWGETKKLFGGDCGWPNFDHVFFVSALTGKGIDNLRTHLRSLSTPIQGDFYFDESMITRAKPRQLCTDHIRSEILNHLPGDIAYNLRVNVIEWDLQDTEPDARLQILADIDCDKLRWAELAAAAMPKIEAAVTDHMRNLFGAEPEVRLRAKFKKQVVEPKH